MQGVRKAFIYGVLLLGPVWEKALGKSRIHSKTLLGFVVYRFISSV
jgi:hypothetical protein